MTSQSLPPPPLTCGTPPPMDFVSDDDEYPYPDDEHFDDVPSLDDDEVIPVPPFDPVLPDSPLALRDPVLPGHEVIGTATKLFEECLEDEFPTECKTVDKEQEVQSTSSDGGINTTLVIESDEEEVKHVDTVPHESNSEEDTKDSEKEQTIVLDEPVPQTTCEVEKIRLDTDCPPCLEEMVEKVTAVDDHNKPGGEEIITNSLEFLSDDEECGNEEVKETSIHSVALENDLSIRLSSGEPCDDEEDFVPKEDFSGIHSCLVEPIAKSVPTDDNIYAAPKDNQLVESSSDAPNSFPLDEDNDFAADFQQFANFADFAPAAPSEFQEFNSHVEATKSTLPIDNAFEDDDDDDFGDFTSSAPAPIPQETHIHQSMDYKIPDVDISTSEEILKAMFASGTESQANYYNVIAKPLVQIQGFETTALTDEYQWAKSRSNKCLVKCLGIDSRNILHGSNWNPEMPRFAANLGFTPLQPMKPSTPMGTIPNAVLMPAVINNTSTNSTTGVLPGDVPAAQFDWDSSGLVNPLHALQAHTLLLDLEQLVVVASLENTKTASNSTAPAATIMAVSPDGIINSGSPIGPRGDGGGGLVDKLYSGHRRVILTYGGEEDSAFSHTIDDRYSPFKAIWMESKGKQTNPTIPEDNKLPEETSPSKLEETNRPTIDELVPDKPMPIPDPIELLPTQFTSPLRETHIFTPVTGVNPISREVNPAVVEIPADNIVVKEYRDVEYDPLKYLGDTNIPIKPETPSTAVDLKKSSSASEIVFDMSVFKAPDTTHAVPSQFSIDDDEADDFSEFQSVPAVSNPSQTSLGVSAIAANTTPVVKLAPTPNVNPLQPLSVTNLTSIVANHTNSRMPTDILMPNILKPQPAAGQSALHNNSIVTNSEIQWPDSKGVQIGTSELNRIEELFANRRGTNSSNQPSAGHLNDKSINQTEIVTGKGTQDEDEWTDFVSGVVKPISGSTTLANGDDEWSDFVSSAPSGPNFTPWQTPSNYQRPMIKSNDLQPELRFANPSPFFISSAGLPSSFGGPPMEREGGKK